MPQERVKRIHLIYGCIAAVLIVVLGVILIISCLDIYNSGPRPYSAESIGMRFDRIAILAYVCIAVVIGGIALNLVLPLEKKRPKAIRDEVELMDKFKAKAGTLADGAAVSAAKERKFRLTLRIITAVAFSASMVYPAIYFADSGNFSITDLSNDIIRAVLVSMIPASIGLLVCFLCSLMEVASVRRETKIYKQAAAANKEQSATPAVRKSCCKQVLVIRCVLLAVCICFIVMGVLNGGMKDVFDKAVAICTECIGLG